MRRYLLFILLNKLGISVCITAILMLDEKKDAEPGAVLITGPKPIASYNVLRLGAICQPSTVPNRRFYTLADIKFNIRIYVSASLASGSCHV